MIVEYTFKIQGFQNMLGRKDPYFTEEVVLRSGTKLDAEEKVNYRRGLIDMYGWLLNEKEDMIEVEITNQKVVE